MNLLQVVEATYSDASSDQAWLANVVETMRPLLRGESIFAYTYRLEPASAPRVLSFVGRDDEREAVDWLVQAAPPPMIHEAFARNRVSTLTEFVGGPVSGVPFLDRVHSPFGLRDSIGMLTIDPSGLGVLVNVGLARAQETTPAFRLRWARVMAHVGAGLRLRRLAAGEPEAVLDAAGKVHHATGVAKGKEARAALRFAARAIDRARAKRADPDEATRLWRALVEGRWTLVDQFESDGRRYLLARPNPVPTNGAARLSKREEQVVALAALGRTNKLIAYELGLSVGTEATLLARAASKLGVRSRSGLIAEWQRRESAREASPRPPDGPADGRGGPDVA